MRQTVFLAVSAIAEAVFGLFMLAATPMMLSVFLGETSPTHAMLWAGRGFGATLITVALAGWFWRQKAGPRAEPKLALGLVAYDVVAVITLIFVGVVLGQTGIGLWPAIIVHALLGVWGAFDLRRPAARS